MASLLYAQSVFSFRRQLTKWHCSQLLLSGVSAGPAAVSAGRAAIDRCFLPAGPAAANPLHAVQRAVDRTDRRTDRRTLYRYIDSAALTYFTSRANNNEFAWRAAASRGYSDERDSVIRTEVWHSGLLWNVIAFFIFLSRDILNVT